MKEAKEYISEYYLTKNSIKCNVLFDFEVEEIIQKVQLDSIKLCHDIFKENVNKLKINLGENENIT